MIRLFRFIFFGDGHKHKWETIHVVALVSVEGDIPMRRKYYLQCEVCGNIKTT